MFIVFTIKDRPENIYFVNSDYFEQALKDRQKEQKDVKWQEMSLARLLRLKDGKTKVFILRLM